MRSTLPLPIQFISEGHGIYQRHLTHQGRDILYMDLYSNYQI